MCHTPCLQFPPGVLQTLGSPKNRGLRQTQHGNCRFEIIQPPVNPITRDPAITTLFRASSSCGMQHETRRRCLPSPPALNGHQSLLLHRPGSRSHRPVRAVLTTLVLTNTDTARFCNSGCHDRPHGWTDLRKLAMPTSDTDRSCPKRGILGRFISPVQRGIDLDSVQR